MAYAQSDKSENEQDASRSILEKVKRVFSELLFPLSGGSAVLGAGLGYLAYVVYCARIGYMPVLNIQDHLGLFLGLTLLGIALIPLIILLPFLPGALLQLLLAPDSQEREVLSKENIKKITYSLFVPSAFFTIVAIWIDAPEKRLTNSLPQVGWMLNAAIIYVLFVPIVLALIPRIRATKSNESLETSGRGTGKAVWATLIASLVSAAVMAGYAPMIRLMGDSLGIETRYGFWVFVLVVIAVVSVGNAVIATMRRRQDLKAACLFIGVYGVFFSLITIGPMSGVLMNTLGLGNVGPIEITVSEADLSRIPVDIRDRLDTRSDLTTHTYAVRGLYLQLHIGPEFRVGIPLVIQMPKSKTNPIASSWSIPESAILAWRVINLKDVQFPVEGEKVEALTEHSAK